MGPGCAVLLKNESAEQWWRIVHDGEEPHGPYELSPTHSLARQLLGQRAGDTIVLREGLEDLSYEIAAVQSKFVRAYQETIDEFSTRFPEHTGLSRVSIKNDDLTKLFQSIDQRHQFADKVDQLYREGRLPFASLASLLGRSALEVWYVCTKDDSTRIRFGTGSEASNEASDPLREADGVVLDLLALLTVHELKLAEHLKSRFSRVAVPQHVLDELQHTAYMTTFNGPAIGSLGKDAEGRYTLMELAEEDWARWQECVGSVVRLAESFERIPSYRLLDAEGVEMLVDILTMAGAGAVYAGDERSAAKMVLVSDDLGLSGLARSLKIDAVNTQTVLWELHRSGVVTSDEYSSWIERLASSNYWLVGVRAEDIVRRLETNGYMTTDGTRAMLRALEGPDCSEDSAVTVGAELITELAGRVPHGQMELLLFAVVANVQHGRETRRVLTKFRDEIASRLALAPPTRDQILKPLDLYMQAAGRNMRREGA